MALAVSVAVIVGMYQVSPYKEAHTPINVAVTTAKISNVHNTITLHGTVTEQGRQAVFSDSMATIRHNYVQIGDSVKKGQLLMALEPLTQEAQISAAIREDVEDTIKAIAQAAAADDRTTLQQQSQMLSGAIAAANTEILFGTNPQVQYLYSPIDGIVMDIAGTPGHSVTTFSPCIVVSDMTQLAVSAEISEQSVGMIREGMSCTVTVAALSDAALTGRIATIMPYARQTGLFSTAAETKTEVLIALAPTGEPIRPGYSAAAKIIINTAEDALLIPYEAVNQDTNQQEYVMLINDSGRAEMRYITTGYELQDGVQVTEGITAEDQLILNAQEITHGKKVVITNAES